MNSYSVNVLAHLPVRCAFSAASASTYCPFESRSAENHPTQSLGPAAVPHAVSYAVILAKGSRCSRIAAPSRPFTLSKTAGKCRPIPFGRAPTVDPREISVLLQDILRDAYRIQLPGPGASAGASIGGVDAVKAGVQALLADLVTKARPGTHRASRPARRLCRRVGSPAFAFSCSTAAGSAHPPPSANEASYLLRHRGRWPSSTSASSHRWRSGSLLGAREL